MNQVQGKFAGLAFAAALATSAATMLSLGTPAAAAEIGMPLAPRVEGVRYADLNLASADGLARLEDRVRNTAERLCGASETHHLAATFAVRKCVKQAIAAAAPQIRQAAVSQRQEQFAARADLAD